MPGLILNAPVRESSGFFTKSKKADYEPFVIDENLLPTKLHVEWWADYVTDELKKRLEKASEKTSFVFQLGNGIDERFSQLVFGKILVVLQNVPSNLSDKIGQVAFSSDFCINESSRKLHKVMRDSQKQAIARAKLGFDVKVLEPERSLTQQIKRKLSL